MIRLLSKGTDSDCWETKGKYQDILKGHKLTNPMKDSERRTIWGSGPVKVGGAKSRKPKVDKKPDNMLKESDEIIDIGGEDEDTAGHRKSEFSLSADVPRDYDHSGAVRCLSLIQQTAPMNPDGDSVDLLIGLSPSEKDLL